MPCFHKQRRLPHSPNLLLDIVLAVEQYPQFLPWCLEAQVRMRSENSLVGDLRVGYGLLNRSFRSKVSFERGKGIIEMKGDSSLFSRFESRWRITVDGKAADSNASGNAALVDFFIDFELRSLPLSFVFENLFCHAAVHMVEAFEQRANSFAHLPTRTLATA